MTSDKKSEKFFKVLHDRMKKAQQEVKSTVTVNMSDIGNKPREDKDSPDHGSKGSRKISVHQSVTRKVTTARLDQCESLKMEDSGRDCSVGE